MIGSLLGAAVRVATLPVVALDAAMDVACGRTTKLRKVY